MINEQHMQHGMTDDWLTAAQPIFLTPNTTITLDWYSIHDIPFYRYCYVPATRIPRPSLMEAILSVASRPYLSVCLSRVFDLLFYSISESRRNFKFCGGITIESDTSNSGNKFEVKMLKLKVKVSWNKNVKIVFRTLSSWPMDRLRWPFTSN